MATPRDPTYPFVPKSTAHMRVGQIWAVPLSNGRYGCGYVVALDPSRRRMFVAGLIDWFGDAPPTASQLVGHRVIEHAKAHLKTITEQGGEILGRVEVPLPVVPDPRDHVWGYNVIRILAEKHAKAG
jgi:hypothetical protein